MRRMMFVVVVQLVGFMLLTSCNGQVQGPVTSLEILLSQEESPRTITPEEGLFDVKGYSVSGSGPGGVTFGPVKSSESKLSVSDLPVGSWTITGSALNSEGNELAIGTGTFNIVKGTNRVSLDLDRIPGYGTMDLSFNWSIDICTDDTISLVIEVEDSKGAVIRRTKDVSRTACTSTFSLPLPAGCHVMTVTVEDSAGSLGIGATEAVRIVANTKSSGTVEMKSIRGGSSGNAADLQISLENKIGLPMRFFIDYSPKAPSKGQSMVLNAMYLSLPDGVRRSDLFYQWYRDGVIMKLGYDETFTTEALSGRHRYDVIVKSPVEGTLCGASLVISVP